ncbi:MAG: beta-Ala-His dipeptidase [Spirochaetes bacterium]|nr:beta-Ala-His dipeptidase [Spirochaetota bacterium]
MKLEKLEPKNLWKNFEHICTIPHPSHHEEALSNWLHQQAKSLGLESKRDLFGNVIVRKPASPGRERRPGIIMQAHIDMVGQAVPGSTHNFARDPIIPRFHPDNQEWLSATGTTLGADNGIGAAAMLCYMEDTSLEHGPMEFLFTTNEEDGMTGAASISSTSLQGKYLLNLDGEEIDEFTIGCGGTVRSSAVLHLSDSNVDSSYRWAKVRVEGLLGGHSGIDINRGRGHASQLLCRILEASLCDCRIATLNGGDTASAIPREAEVLAGVPEWDFDSWRQDLEAEARHIAGELDETDPGFNLSFTPCAAPLRALDVEESRILVDLIRSIPNGILAMETAIANTVRTSSNLGILKLTHEAPGATFLETMCLIRSTSDDEKLKAADEIEDILFRAGATTKRPVTSPAWTPEPQSPLLATATTCYQNLFGKLPGIAATHAALECGMFRPLYPHWDMISLGPLIRNPHSPEEMVHIESVAMFWQLLQDLVRAL